MSGTITASGLITGLDTNSLISQLVQLERQPITKMQGTVTTLTSRKSALSNLLTQLQTLRSRAQDFRLASPFTKFTGATNASSVANVSITGSDVVSGTYAVTVAQLATATIARSSARMGGGVDPAVPLASNGMATAVNGGVFTINGVAFSVDPATQSLNDVLTAINASAAGVAASYDPAEDKVTLANAAAGNTAIINFGATGDTSNFLAAINVIGATQSTNGSGSTTTRSTVNLGAVNIGSPLNAIDFGGGPISSGTFSINGIAFVVDATQDALTDVLNRINQSDAQVTATYDAASDSVQLASKVLGSRTIALASGTSNFLGVTNLIGAAQTAGMDSQFSVNGGPLQTRNGNTVSDAIPGVTLNFLSVGSASVTVSQDMDAAVASVKSFLDEVNRTLSQIGSLTAKNGTLAGDGSISIVSDYLKNILLGTVSGASGSYSNLTTIGVSTGNSFDSKAEAQYQLDESALRKALSANPNAVASLFTNSGGDGIADRLNTYIDGIANTNGYLRMRVSANGEFDQRIKMYNDRIGQLQERLTQYETRLRKQFTRLETMSAQFQAQNTALARLSNSLSSL
ncbi:MAG TPA: flagellar filament capping protein FliD [Candidatus Hydrogenedentes bacterium]|nr:flagellar filament capping protein FliD [Candidatus Hydrogenedentota bacterium]